MKTIQKLSQRSASETNRSLHHSGSFSVSGIVPQQRCLYSSSEEERVRSAAIKNRHSSLRFLSFLVVIVVVRHCHRHETFTAIIVTFVLRPPDHAFYLFFVFWSSNFRRNMNYVDVCFITISDICRLKKIMFKNFL